MATNVEELKALDLENQGGEQEQEAVKRAAQTDKVVRGVNGSVVPRARKLRPLSELPGWRDDPDRAREDAEERLNAQLCKYLNAVASERFPMVMFHHEEKQTGTRRVDVSALRKERGFVGQTVHTIYDPFLVFEGKRLPTPARNREREYVTGGSDKGGDRDSAKQPTLSGRRNQERLRDVGRRRV